MRPNRREALQFFGAVAFPWGLGLCANPAHAGAQVEEPLSAAVRTALSAAVADEAPPKPTFDKDDERHEHERWLQRLSARLTRVKSETQTREEFLQTVWYESRRAALDTSLVLGLIQVESGFRKYAISSAGARVDRGIPGLQGFTCRWKIRYYAFSLVTAWLPSWKNSRCPRVRPSNTRG